MSPIHHNYIILLLTITSPTIQTLAVTYPNTARIIGGHAPTEDYPWMASIHDSALDSNLQHYCGGALIAPDIVITAAHCAQYREPTNRVQLGSTALPGMSSSSMISSNNNNNDNNDEEQEDVEVWSIEEYTVHPNYNFNGLLYHDLAILKLSGSSSITPISMDTVTLTSNSTVIKHMGWGQTENRNTTRSDVLLQLELTYLDVQDCDATTGYTITNDILCGIVNTNASQAGVCSGDSGGPVVSTDGSNVLLGVASFIIGGCGNKRYPDGFASVIAGYDWIVAEACRMSSHDIAIGYCPGFSHVPSVIPSSRPSFLPTHYPTSSPSLVPTNDPSFHPSVRPIEIPSIIPSVKPTSRPSVDPSSWPTFPMLTPSSMPSIMPTIEPPLRIDSSRPTMSPSVHMDDSIPPTGGIETLTSVPSLVPTVSDIQTFEPSIAATNTNSPSANPILNSMQPSILKSQPSVAHSLRIIRWQYIEALVVASLFLLTI